MRSCSNAVTAIIKSKVSDECFTLPEGSTYFSEASTNRICYGNYPHVSDEFFEVTRAAAAIASVKDSLPQFCIGKDAQRYARDFRLTHPLDGMGVAFEAMDHAVRVQQEAR